MIAISLSPNTTPADVRQAWKMLHLTSQWEDDSIIPVVSQKISERLGRRPVAVTASGRQALHDILKALDIGQGDEVIIQAFTCIAVPEPILWAGATPIYADIAAGTYNLDPQSVEARITPRTKAIIVQHTFGIPAPIQELQAIAKKHNLFLIEDLAHGLGGTLNGQPLGTFADIAFLSFGRDKTISSVFGGAVVSKHLSLISKIQQLADKRSYPPSSWVARQLAHPILFSFIVPNYFRLAIGKAALVAAQKIGLLSKAVTPGERTGQKPKHFFYRYSPALAHLLDLQLDQLPIFTKKRQQIAKRYMNKFAPAPSRPAPQGALHPLPTVPPDANPSWLRFPLQVDKPRDIHRKARGQRMLLGDWYNSPLVPGNCNLKAFQYTPGACPVAEETARHVINLPTHPRMDEKDVAQVIEFITHEINK